MFYVSQVSICLRPSLRTLICVTIASNARELSWLVLTRMFLSILFLTNDVLVSFVSES